MRNLLMRPIPMFKIKTGKKKQKQPLPKPKCYNMNDINYSYCFCVSQHFLGARFPRDFFPLDWNLFPKSPPFQARGKSSKVTGSQAPPEEWWPTAEEEVWSLRNLPLGGGFKCFFGVYVGGEGSGCMEIPTEDDYQVFPSDPKAGV